MGLRPTKRSGQSDGWPAQASGGGAQPWGWGRRAEAPISPICLPNASKQLTATESDETGLGASFLFQSEHGPQSGQHGPCPAGLRLILLAWNHLSPGAWGQGRGGRPATHWLAQETGSEPEGLGWRGVSSKGQLVHLPPPAQPQIMGTRKLACCFLTQPSLNSAVEHLPE